MRATEALRRLREAGHAPSPLVMRDEAGAWWRVDVETGRWFHYRPEETRWVGADARPTSLLLGAVPVALDDAAPSKDLPPVVDGDARDSIEGLVRDAGEAFRAGRLDSRATEELIAEFVLLDRSGRVWTTGFESGAWYAFFGGGWERQDVRPDLAALMDPRECQEAGASGLTETAAAVLLSFLEHGIGTVPEPVVEDWNPPPVGPDLTES